MARELKRIADQVDKVVSEPPESDRIVVKWDRGIISTGSTTLDLAISGGRVRGGGLPGGIIVEIFGPSKAGKTAVMSEICGYAQAKGGDIFIADPEARFDKEYARIYGVSFDQDHYSRPDTVPEMFQGIWDWKPEPKKEGTICVYGGDSLAALSTDLELSEKGDKRGQRRAKEFSEWLRKTTRIIANNNWLIPLTNQVRQGEYGDYSPGGKAIEFYSTVRIKIGPALGGWRLVRKSEVGDQEHEKTVGRKSRCIIDKNSLDDEDRSADIFIMYGYGIDDVRGNLQYLKDKGYKIIKNKKTQEEKPTSYSWYPCIDKEIQSLDKAVEYIEANGYQDQLREKVIDLWYEIENSFKMNRKPKQRG